METLEAVKHSKATLEAQLNTQRSLIENMRVELAGAKVRAAHAVMTRTHNPQLCMPVLLREADSVNQYSHS